MRARLEAKLRAAWRTAAPAWAAVPRGGGGEGGKVGLVAIFMDKIYNKKCCLVMGIFHKGSDPPQPPPL